jgi:glycyl-tRNA synthetase
VSAGEKTGERGRMDQIVSLCKRRGFIFPSSEVYGGLASAWDYGPLGVALKNRLRDLWWREMTQLHDNIVGLDAAILMHPKVWEASGHVQNFTDPLVDCRNCKSRFRADQVDLASPCPTCGQRELTDPRQFNMMFRTQLGPVEGGGTEVYLRPETAQGAYVNFKNVQQASRLKIPFGIAQVGKAFRNEITTKSFIFRTCEFEQMEMQYFVHPDEADRWFEHWRQERFAYYQQLGIRAENLRLRPHADDERAHYARAAVDIEYQFPFGWQELEGIHDRGNYDLSQHMAVSGKDFSYLDEVAKERFVPYVVETAVGLTRTVLMILLDAYAQDEVEGETRTLLRLHPRVAPITAAVFPLVKKDGLAELAQAVELELRTAFPTFYDQGGAIGRRYRRQDEIGTPFCVTVDYATKDDATVTLRFRDSTEQVRVPRQELVARISAEMDRYVRPEES